MAELIRSGEPRAADAAALAHALELAYELYGLADQIARTGTFEDVALPNRAWMEAAVRDLLDRGVIRVTV